MYFFSTRITSLFCVEGNAKIDWTESGCNSVHLIHRITCTPVTTRLQVTANATCTFWESRLTAANSYALDCYTFAYHIRDAHHQFCNKLIIKEDTICEKKQHTTQNI